MSIIKLKKNLTFVGKFKLNKGMCTINYKTLIIPHRNCNVDDLIEKKIKMAYFYRRILEAIVVCMIVSRDLPIVCFELVSAYENSLNYNHSKGILTIIWELSWYRKLRSSKHIFNWFISLFFNKERVTNKLNL
jgi:hypothetical protein